MGRFSALALATLVMTGFGIAQAELAPPEKLDQLDDVEEAAAKKLLGTSSKQLSLCSVASKQEAEKWIELDRRREAEGKESSAVSGRLIGEAQQFDRVYTRALTLTAQSLDREEAESVWNEHVDLVATADQLSKGYMVSATISCRVRARDALGITFED